MTKAALVAAAILLAGPAWAAAPLQFWNTSSRAFSGVYLAPAGTTNWGPNETANDPDGAVSADERLKLPDVAPGRYDVRVVDQKGRSCVVKDVEARANGPYAFSIGDPELKACRR